MQYRRYIISSSFKMAVLFAALLGVSIASLLYIYLRLTDSLTHNLAVKYMSAIAIFSMILVILISFFISIFVVKRINHIAQTAISIMNTGDLTQRIHIKTSWDDLSNLAFVLNSLFEKVESLLKDIKHVSDNIAHDLRTPLTRLHNNLQSLDQQFSSNETRLALHESERLLSIFNALLRITHLEHGKQQLFCEYMSIKKLVADVCELYEPIFEQNGIALELCLEDVSIFLDKDMMFQVFVNILDNIVRHALNGKVVNIVGGLEREFYKIWISDQGQGVSSASLQKIFDRFYQEKMHRSVEGSGLGLALVKAIVLRHGGKIACYPTVPQGLTIEIALPLTNITYI